MEVKIGDVIIAKDGVEIRLTIDEAKDLSKKLQEIFWPKFDFDGTTTGFYNYSFTTERPEADRSE